MEKPLKHQRRLGLTLTMLDIFINYTPPQFYPVNLQFLHAFTRGVEHSVYPDQLASEKPTDLDLHCFFKCDI